METFLEDEAVLELADHVADFGMAELVEMVEGKADAGVVVDANVIRPAAVLPGHVGDDGAAALGEEIVHVFAVETEEEEAAVAGVVDAAKEGGSGKVVADLDDGAEVVVAEFVDNAIDDVTHEGGGETGLGGEEFGGGEGMGDRVWGRVDGVFEVLDGEAIEHEDFDEARLGGELGGEVAFMPASENARRRAALANHGEDGFAGLGADVGVVVEDAGDGGVGDAHFFSDLFSSKGHDQACLLKG